MKLDGRRVEPLTRYDFEVAERAARAINETRARRGLEPINARVDATGAIISNASPKHLLPKARRPITVKKPKKFTPVQNSVSIVEPEKRSVAVKIQEYLTLRTGEWFRPKYIMAVLKLKPGETHTALCSLRNAGIIQRRCDEVIGANSVQYSIAPKGASE